MTQTDDYIVRLDAFEGPLDLLLHLIRRAEVEITDIPIATVTDQYIEHLRGIERIDIELAGEFLVMAATLMEIKSRMLMPPLEGESRAATDDDTADAIDRTDPRAELVQQLLAYKRFRDAAASLEDRLASWERRFPAAATAIDLRAAVEHVEPDMDLEDLQLFDIVEAFGRIMETVDVERASRGTTHQITFDETPIELHAEDILDRLRRGASAHENGAPAEDGRARLTLRELLSERTRAEMIGLFLALLELLRRRAVTIEQDRAGEDVRIAINDDPGEGMAGELIGGGEEDARE